MASQENTASTYLTEAQVWHERGIEAFRKGDLAAAVSAVEHSITLVPDVSTFYRTLGELHRQAGDIVAAVAAGEMATDLAPNDADAHYNYGLALADKGDHERAKAAYTRATQLRPEHNLAWNNLGATLEALGQKTAALEAYLAACRIAPEHAEAQNNAGAIYIELGQLEAARSHLEAAIAARPNFAEAHQNLSGLKTYSADDPHILQLESLVLRASALSNDAHVRLSFALGKARADLGYHAGAFAAYAEANRLHRAGVPNFEPRAEHLHQAMAQALTTKAFTARSGAGHSDPTPVFIVGMPRSGTTLVEQIIASHSAGVGAGELRDFLECLRGELGLYDLAEIENWIDNVPDAAWARIGNAYCARLREHGPGAVRIVDKMPGNHLLAGLIHLALPDARIIHCLRDPMDSCWSNYTRLFTDTMEFAYDLGELGRQYNRYIKLMTHWDSALPADRLLHLRYESLVVNFEPQVRALLAHIGLPFDPACLAFHETKRTVKTASFAQVRQPIYQSSVGRWQGFARHLEPLRDVVGHSYPHGLCP